jgi:hypothetical protein
MTRADMHFEGIGYSEHTTQKPGDNPVYRFFETTFGGHFFTDSATERDTVMATRSDIGLRVSRSSLQRRIDV